MFVQVMSDAEARAFPFNPFDLTKVWPKGDFPLIEVGYFELNRNPENFFAEVEQASFCPAHVVPGISFSPDKMLQARLFAYGDAARYRLGVNHHLIPVNAPKCPYHSYHRDGAMRTDGNLGRTPTYFPNSLGEWTDQPDLNEPPLEIDGAAAHWDHRVEDDHYQQPGNLLRKMGPAQRQLLLENTARQIGAASVHIQQRHIENCTKADPAYGAGVQMALASLQAVKDVAAEQTSYKQLKCQPRGERPCRSMSKASRSLTANLRRKLRSWSARRRLRYSSITRAASIISEPF
jgi:catalase